VLDKYKEDPSKQEFGRSFEKTFILRNHDQIMNIIETSGHLIGGDKEVLTMVNKYTEHVAVYKALHEMGDPRDPYNFDPNLRFPKDFRKVIEEKSEALQGEYDSLLKRFSAA
jgi:hypothetical protein